MKRARTIPRDVLTFCAIALSFCLLGIFACFYLITWEDRLVNGFPKQPAFGLITSEKWWSKLEDRVESIYFRSGRVGVRAKESFRERFRNLRAVDPEAVINNGQLKQFNPGVSSTEKCGSSTRFLSCKEVREIEIIGEVGYGYTKFVQRGFYKGEKFAVKSVRRATKDVERCVADSQSPRSVNECMKLSKYKLAKEIILLQQLRHSNIVQVSEIFIKIWYIRVYIFEYLGFLVTKSVLITTKLTPKSDESVSVLHKHHHSTGKNEYCFC